MLSKIISSDTTQVFSESKIVSKNGKKISEERLLLNKMKAHMSTLQIMDTKVKKDRSKITKSSKELKNMILVFLNKCQKGENLNREEVLEIYNTLFFRLLKVHEEREIQEREIPLIDKKTVREAHKLCAKFLMNTHTWLSEKADEALYNFDQNKLREVSSLVISILTIFERKSNFSETFSENIFENYGMLFLNTVVMELNQEESLDITTENQLNALLTKLLDMYTKNPSQESQIEVTPLLDNIVDIEKMLTPENKRKISEIKNCIIFNLIPLIKNNKDTENLQAFLYKVLSWLVELSKEANLESINRILGHTFQIIENLKELDDKMSEAYTLEYLIIFASAGEKKINIDGHKDAMFKLYCEAIKFNTKHQEDLNLVNYNNSKTKLKRVTDAIYERFYRLPRVG